MGEFGFALLILKLFETRFVTFGALYTAFALLLLAFGWIRTELGKQDFEKSGDRVFVTCGTVVALTSKLMSFSLRAVTK